MDAGREQARVGLPHRRVRTTGVRCGRQSGRGAAAVTSPHPRYRPPRRARRGRHLLPDGLPEPSARGMRGRPGG